MPYEGLLEKPDKEKMILFADDMYEKYLWKIF